LKRLAKGWAVSSLKRDAADEIRSQSREDFARGVEVEDLARTVVQGVFDGGELLMADLAEVHALGQVFADQVGPIAFVWASY
jgi:hypothetical protein